MSLFDANISDVENRRLFVCYLTLTIFASVTYFIAFVSPCWIVADSGSYALFNKIGLWTACFDGYMRPNQFNKAYFGCFYLYYTEYDSIRDWLNPGKKLMFNWWSMAIRHSGYFFCWDFIWRSRCIFCLMSGHWPSRYWKSEASKVAHDRALHRRFAIFS